MNTARSTLNTEQDIWKLLNEIPDPEVPAISIVELGVVREIDVDGNTVNVKITPTYSGCPALKTMQDAVVSKLTEHGFVPRISTIFKPAWTTDWISDEAREKLRAYGIAPPEGKKIMLHPFAKETERIVKCPFCNSENTSLTSQFGSTACKALHYCNHCNQPFEEFKCH